MLTCRRLPGFIMLHLYAITILSIIVIFILIKLFSWRIVCTNFEPYRHVKSLCNQFEMKLVTGDLCPALCNAVIHSYTCQPLHSGKKVVFTATHLDNTKMVFKMARNEDNHYFDNITLTRYLNSETGFQRLIKRYIYLRLNITISLNRAKFIGQYDSGDRTTKVSDKRKSEMLQIWMLLQDNEYLLATLFSEEELFPKMLGSCGQYFAMEYLKPALEGYIPYSDTESKESWQWRVRLAFEIMVFLRELDESVKGGLMLCDIKQAHFGISKAGKLKFLDLDVVFPKKIADSMIDHNATCSNDYECDFFDCKSKCDLTTKKCGYGILSDNLQIICEKIFIGWQGSRKILAPGLLLSHYTPMELSTPLRTCGESNLFGVEADVKHRLMLILTEIDRHLSLGFEY